jgi:hypothetical protein
MFTLKYLTLLRGLMVFLFPGTAYMFVLHIRMLAVVIFLINIMLSSSSSLRQQHDQIQPHYIIILDDGGSNHL